MSWSRWTGRPRPSGTRHSLAAPTLDATLDALCAELHRLWLTFDRDLRLGKLKTPRVRCRTQDPVVAQAQDRSGGSAAGRLLCQAAGAGHRRRLPLRQRALLLLAALSPLQPRYAKKIADDDSLMAVILAQAMNHGNLGMAETSDIPYHVLEATHQQHLRLSTLKAANDRSAISSPASASSPYSFDPEVLYGSVDGQKFRSADPTIKARHRASTSAPARASSPTRCWPTTCRWRRS